jgi:hypothetical protein
MATAGGASMPRRTTLPRIATTSTEASMPGKRIFSFNFRDKTSMCKPLSWYPWGKVGTQALLVTGSPSEEEKTAAARDNSIPVALASEVIRVGLQEG